MANHHCAGVANGSVHPAGRLRFTRLSHTSQGQHRSSHALGMCFGQNGQTLTAWSVPSSGSGRWTENWLPGGLWVVRILGPGGAPWGGALTPRMTANGGDESPSRSRQPWLVTVTSLSGIRQGGGWGRRLPALLSPGESCKIQRPKQSLEPENLPVNSNP